MSAPVACEPLLEWLPAQTPEAVQEVALVDVHVNVDPLPLVTVLGLAARVRVGDGAVTETVVD